MALVNQAELAREAGVSRQIISRYVRAGRIPKKRNGKIDLDEGKRILAEIENKGSNGNGNGHKPTLWDEQARLAGHKADIAAMESKRLSGELVEVDRVVSEFGKLVVAVRQRLLGLGSRLAPLGANRSPAVLQKIIDDAIHEVLNEFGDYNAETGECRPQKPARKNRSGGKKAKAAAKAKRKRVVK